MDNNKTMYMQYNDIITLKHSNNLKNINLFISLNTFLFFV